MFPAKVLITANSTKTRLLKLNLDGLRRPSVDVDALMI